MPVRIQQKRTKGYKLPPNTVSVTRPGKWGNPFRVGGYYMIGDPRPQDNIRMSWCQALTDEAKQDPRFTKIECAAQAVDFFRRLSRAYNPKHWEPLRGKNLACFCKIGDPCHADILLKIANES